MRRSRRAIDKIKKWVRKKPALRSPHHYVPRRTLAIKRMRPPDFHQDKRKKFIKQKACG